MKTTQQAITLNKETTNFFKKTNNGFRAAETLQGIVLSSGESNGYNIVRLSSKDDSTVAHCVVTEEGDILFAVKFMLTCSGMRDTALYNAIAADAIRAQPPYAFCSLYPGYKLVDTLYITGDAVRGVGDKLVRDLVITSSSKYSRAADEYAAFVVDKVLGSAEMVSHIKSLCPKRVKVPRGDVQIRQSISTAGNSVKSSDGTFSMAYVRKYKANGKYMRVYAMQGPDANVCFVLSPNGTPLFRLGDMLLGPVWTAGMCSIVWQAIEKHGNIDRNNVCKIEGSPDGIKHRARYASADLILEAVKKYNARTEVAHAMKKRAVAVATWLVEVSSKRSEICDMFDKMGICAEKRRCTDVGTKAKQAEPEKDADTGTVENKSASAAPGLFDTLVDDVPLQASHLSYPEKPDDKFANDVLQKALQPKIDRAKAAIAEKREELARITKKFEDYKALVEKDIQSLMTKLGQYNSMKALSGSVFKETTIKRN